jgi:hypothetical protein
VVSSSGQAHMSSARLATVPRRSGDASGTRKHPESSGSSDSPTAGSSSGSNTRGRRLGANPPHRSPHRVSLRGPAAAARTPRNVRSDAPSVTRLRREGGMPPCGSMRIRSSACVGVRIRADRCEPAVNAARLATWFVAGSRRFKSRPRHGFAPRLSLASQRETQRRARDSLRCSAPCGSLRSSGLRAYMYTYLRSEFRNGSPRAARVLAPLPLRSFAPSVAARGSRGASWGHDGSNPASAPFSH